jgi:hypothetical protein
MIVTKTALPRRTFLRGAGVTLALPLLDAMVPALTAVAKTAAKPIPRLGFIYVPNGMFMPNWMPKGEGANFTLSPILEPLKPVRDHVVIVTGLGNPVIEKDGVGAAPHTRCHAAWLNGTAPKRTEGADIQSGVTVDQVAARELGRDTPLMSLELALEAQFLVGNCANGYSCAYLNSTSWRTPTMPLPMETNPRNVFERLYGYAGDEAFRQRQMRLDHSILDAVTREMTALSKSLGPADRVMVEGYFEAVRDVEKRIQRLETRTSTSVTMEQPSGIPANFDEHAKLMFDLQLLAYRADITRVATFQIGREQSMRSYGNIGVDNAHHEVSHHQNNAEKVAANTKINIYHMSLFARMIDNMRQTQDGDGTLLDHSMLMYGSGMGDGDLHSPHNLPLVLAGGGCGQLKGGRHLNVPNDTRLMNLGVTLLDKAGVHVASIGDSDGRIEAL